MASKISSHENKIRKFEENHKRLTLRVTLGVLEREKIRFNIVLMKLKEMNKSNFSNRN